MACRLGSRGLWVGPRRRPARLGGRGSGPGGGGGSPDSGNLTWLAPVTRWLRRPRLFRRRAAPRRLHCPQPRWVRLRPPLTGSPVPRSLIWRLSQIRGLPRPPQPRALPRPATPPRRRAACRHHAPARPGHALLAGLRLRAMGIAGGRDVARDSNQYRKRGATRCRGQPRPEEDLGPAGGGSLEYRKKPMLTLGRGS